ncbi:MAG TPA: hypothetical protein VLZ76_03710 [Lysobacter sp.]|nr:hypothetical protein [Lysobacter sp.]
MALTLGLTGMDPATEASLKAAFADANQRTGGAWQLLPDTQAEHVVVDMDSMYGPMSWLRLHAAGKTVIGLTSAPRTQADFRLAQPFDAHSLHQMLEQLAPSSAATSVPVDTVPQAIPQAAVPAGLSPAPQPQDQLPEEQPQRVDEEAAALAPTEEVSALREPPSAAAAQVVPAVPSMQPHTPPPVIAEARTLGDWLASGKVSGQVKFERDGIALLIDTEQRQYFGPAGLKPLATHVCSDVSAADFVPVADWSAQIAKQEAQPLSRLIWLGGLLSSPGELLPGFDPEARYQLVKWPQTEREYPKHFRIATVMMKGPATLAEIAQASGVPLTDVTDFVNANLATGFADIEHLPEPEAEPRKSGGLFGRLRGR